MQQSMRQSTWLTALPPPLAAHYCRRGLACRQWYTLLFQSRLGEAYLRHGGAPGICSGGEVKQAH